MNEFELIDVFFKSMTHHREDVILGIGDDASCLRVPDGMALFVSCDTLVADVHFLPDWDAYDIAFKAVMVNLSDLAAMGAKPAWLTLALTLPEFNSDWLMRYSQGLRDALDRFNLALVGGDTTKGPLSMTLTIHGLAPEGRLVGRHGANPGDKIFVSGELGAAAQAVAFLNQPDVDGAHQQRLMEKLLHPVPRVDLCDHLQQFATAAIDISDGLGADLNHICQASQVGACLAFDQLPIHPLVRHYQAAHSFDFAMKGGDDYELCFTVAPQDEVQFLEMNAQLGLNCTKIGQIQAHPGLWVTYPDGRVRAYPPEGYAHF